MRRAATAAGTTILVVLAAVLFAIALAPHAGIRATILTSGSMEPTVPAGGMIAVEEVDHADIEVGDVITFQGYAEDRLITHRVLGVHDVKGDLHFQTQGDANEFPDGDLAPAAGVVGRMRWDLTALGPVLAWLSGSRATMLLPGLAGLWLAVGEVREVRRARGSAPAVRRRHRSTPTAQPTLTTLATQPPTSPQAPVPPPWLVLPLAPAPPPPPPPLAAPLLEPATVPAGLSWSAAARRSHAGRRTRHAGGRTRHAGGRTRHAGARFATVGLATVLAVSAVQVSAGSFLDGASVSLATIGTTTVEAPTGTAATFDCGLSTIGQHVVVEWTGAAGADDYDVRRRVGSSGDFSSVGSTASTSFTDTTIGLDTTYEYVVATRSGTWASSPSTPPAEVVTPAECTA